MIPAPEKRIADFEKLGFGMFVHFGLYSQRNAGEWTMAFHGIPKDEYEKLFSTFTAEDFDAKEIVSLAKSAGAKYITLTARHHEGFSLYDTKGLNDYDSPHSPAGRDLIKEFVDECNAQGIIPMLYHTTIDWREESYKTDFNSYLEYLRKSVEILCKNYGKIGGFWFDGNWEKPDDDWREDELYQMIRKYQPDAMIINNTGMERRGHKGNMEIDSLTFEQGKPVPIDRDGAEKYLAAEMCQTISGVWGFSAKDFAYKSLSEIIETLCLCRGVGANYLLNIGPIGHGKIDKLQAAMLEKVGEWINIFGKSLYDGRPSDLKCEGRDFVLDIDDKAHIYIFDLGVELTAEEKKAFEANPELTTTKGKGKRSVVNVDRKVKSIKWVDSGEEIPFTQTGSRVVYEASLPYANCPVVRTAEITYE